MKKLILLIIVICMVVSVNAAIPNLGNFKQDAPVDLRQTCTINGTFCDLCNISSVDYPNGTIAISNVIMTKRQGDFNFTFDDTFTNPLGQYRVNGYCKFGSDVIKNFAYYFDITVSGTKLSTSGSILYVIFLITLLGIFALSLFGAVVIPFKNPENEQGRLIGVNQLKFVKMALVGMSYLLLVVISFVGYGITRNFLFLNALSGMFNAIFWILVSGALPVTLVLIVILISNFVTDKKLQAALKRGLPFR